jgi:HSP20 family molecular chaperone IbpA
MFTHFNAAKECTIYPGIYTATPERVHLTENSIIPSNSSFILAEPSVHELQNMYKMIIEIDAANREDIFINIDDTVLFISVLHHKNKDPEEYIQSRNGMGLPIETNYIILPRYADTEFMSAEFNEGVLTLCIPKNGEPVRNNSKEVIVY